MAADRGDRSRLRPIRWRTTGIAVAVVGVCLVATGIALVVTLRNTITDQVREDATQRATEIAATWDPGSRPDLSVADAEDTLIQIVAADGSVVAASSNATGEPAVADLADGESAVVQTALSTEDYLAVAVGVSGERRTVIVARSLDDVTETTRVVTISLIIGVPLLLLVVGATTWWMLGPMLTREERATRRQRQFVSDASHELRSPIAAIRQHAEVALAHPERHSLDGLAEPVLAETIRLQDLVEDLLLLARVDEHGLRLERRPVDLDDLVLDEIRRLRTTTSLVVDGAGVTAVRVSGDNRMLARVLRNIGDNAGRHAHTKVALSTSHRHGQVELWFDDDGLGVPADDRERVFERFIRLDEARARDHGGSGLGLAIVAEVMRAHGGTASIDDSPLGGTRVRITLPVADES